MAMEAFLAVGDLRATAQHIDLLDRKIERLLRLRDEAWEQILTAAARKFATQEIAEADVVALYEAMRSSYGTNFTQLWDRIMPIQANRVRHCARDTPNGLNGSWYGVVPIGPQGRSPKPGQAVVYVLFNGVNEPVYVGSTGNFRTRLVEHRREKPDIAHWVAYPCRDREHAYLLEEQLLEEHRPLMNRRAGR